MLRMEVAVVSAELVLVSLYFRLKALRYKNKKKKERRGEKDGKGEGRGTII
jgi:hypothetical protein